MRSYAHDARVILVANVVSALAGLGVQACLAWYLLPEGRGEYAACILFALLLTLACALGQEMANIHFISAKKIDVSQAMSQSLLVGAITSLTACGLGYMLTLTSLSFLSVAPVSFYRLALLNIPAVIFHMYLSRIFLGMALIRTFAWLMMAPRLLALAALLLGAVTYLDVGVAILIEAGSYALVAIAALGLLVFRHRACLTRPRRVALLRSLGYGVRFCFGKLASMTNVQMGTIILAVSAVTPDKIGLFAAASALAGRLWLVAEALQTAMLPRSSADPEGRSQMIAQCVRLCLACTVVVVVLMFLLSKPIISVILSPHFLPVLVPFQVLLPGVAVRVIPKILAAYFNGIGRPGVVSMAIAAALAMNLALMYVLLPLWGLIGVACAMSAAYTLEAAILIFAFRHGSGVSIGSLLRPRRSDFDTLWKVARQALRGTRSRSAILGEE